MKRTLPIILLLLVFGTSSALAQALSGDYYVGAAGTAPEDADPEYSSLGDAFADLNEHGADGAVTLLITSDLDESESELLLIDVGLTAETPLTIRPAEGTTPTVSLGILTDQSVLGNASAGIVNTGYVTIDGSAEVGGDSRDLTLLHAHMTPTRAFGIAGDSPDVAIRNTKINIDFPRGGTVGVRISSVSGVAPANTQIENNQIGAEGASYLHGVALLGVDNGGVDDVVIDTDIINNDIWGSQRVITTWVPGNARYEGNRLHLTGQYNSTSFQSGMYIVLARDLHIAGNEFIGATTNNATFQPATGIVFNSNSGDIFVYNNMFAVPEFSNEGAGEDSEYIAIGLNHAGGAGGHHYIYNNTIRLGSSSQSGILAAFGASVTIGGNVRITETDQGWELRNNVIVVEHDADNAYGIHWPVDHQLDSDNNNLYAPNGYIGHYNDTDVNILGAWRAVAGADHNSISKELDFVSETDLRLTGASLGDRDLRGAPLSLVAVDIDGNERDAEFPYIGAHEGNVWLSTDGRDGSELAEAFELHQNYPNPFNPSTTISYTLRDPGHVHVQVYNAVGQLVHTLVDGYELPGVHEVNFDAGNLASGLYLYRMEVDGRSETKQMMLVK